MSDATAHYYYLFIVLHLAAVPLLGFIYRYGRWNRWTETAEGRTIMFQKFGFLGIVLLTLVRMYIQPHAFLVPADEFTVLREILFSYIVVMFWVMFISLLRAQAETMRVVKKYKLSKKMMKDLKDSSLVSPVPDVDDTIDPYRYNSGEASHSRFE